MNTKQSLTATNLAVYQHLNCDLYIHNVYNGAVASTASPGTGSTSPSELAKAQYKRGLDWESSLYSWLDESNLLLKVPSLPSDGETLLENIFADDREHFFVTGLTFWPPQAKLSKKFEAAGTAPLTFGLAKPDLLEIKRTTDGIEWRVIDAKASRNVKSSHHIQIYFYTLCLNHLLQPPNFRGQDAAGIWLPPKDGFHDNSPSFEDIKSISMSLLASPLDALIFRILPKVIVQPRSDVKWHLNPLCHGCKYEPDCKQRTVDDGELGNIPNVSIDDARALKELLRMAHASSRSNTNSKQLTDIEDLHNIIADRTKLEHISKLSPSVVKKAKQVLALPKKIKLGEIMQSPVVEAARSKKTQIIPRRNYTCPRQEDIAVFISIFKDPASANGGGDYFHVVSYSSKPIARIPSTIIANSIDFLPQLADLIRAIESSGHTSQFYVWSYPEQALLQAYIINTALTSLIDDADIRLCIGALSQGASLLQTTFQPLLLSGALMAFLGKGRKLKVEYQKCLGRLGLSMEGTVDMLKKRLETKLKELQDDALTTRAMDDEERRKEFGQLPRVVVLKKEVERQLALPIPGYWDLPECHSELLGGSVGACPDDEEVFSAFHKQGQSRNLDELLSKRNSCMYDVLKKLRSQAVSAAGHSLFVNDAKRMSTRFMDFCRQEEIRKLFFMQQFEVLAKLTELWQSRIDGCPEAPSLKYVGPKAGRQGTEHVFRVTSGTVDVPSPDKDRAFYDKLLVLDSSDSLMDEDAADKLPVEALFDDLGVSGLVFPLNRWTKAAWLRQDTRVQQELVVADLRNVYMDPTSTGTMVTLRSWGTNNGPFVQGAVYRLSPRLVDFNTTKILSALFEIDMDWEYGLDELKESGGKIYPHAFIPFVQLILNPNSLGKAEQSENFLKTENQIQGLFRQLRDLKNSVAGSLVLKNSQHRATQRILTNRLSVIWGPPGTGKTYTISLSLLRLIEVDRRISGPRQKIIFVTAITHAAIEACRSKLGRLMASYKSISDLPTEWLSDVEVSVVSNGNDHPGPRNSGNTVHVYMGTVYQLFNFSKKNSLQVDCLVVDEAGQISLGSISLVLRSLSHEGRIVVAGDSEQLAPILSAQYPLLKAHSLFGSVLDCLMFPRALPLSARPPSPSFDESQGMAPTSSPGTIVQLTENFRLNPDLSEFVSTIYSRKFKPQKAQARELGAALSTITQLKASDLGLNSEIFGKVQKFLGALSGVMKDRKSTAQSGLVAPEVQLPMSTVTPRPGSPTAELDPISLALIRLRTFPFNISYESHVQAEAAVTASLVACLRKCAPDDDIFVATPHRIQREAVKAALRAISNPVERLEDTFGKLRVSDEEKEANKVTVDTIERLQGSEASFVICLFSVPKSYSVDLAFLLERRRLNVAISRAKALCILISSDEVLCPSVKALANEETAKGYAFLKAFQKRAWSFYLQLNADKVTL